MGIKNKSYVDKNWLSQRKLIEKIKINNEACL